MRKILLCIGFCLLLFSSFPVYAAQIKPLEGEAVITSNKLNVRSGPSKEYNIIGSLDKEQIVEVTGIVEPDWFVIEYNGNQGYIYGEYLIFTPAEEEEEAEEETVPEIPMRTYLIVGLSAVILVVAGLIIYTAISLREKQEEEDIPISDHEDANMHQGEVTYDTYRLDIDPSFFETAALEPQPESVFEDESNTTSAAPARQDVSVGNSGNAADIQMIDSRLEQATAQLAALQKEVEELKKQKLED